MGLRGELERLLCGKESDPLTSSPLSRGQRPQCEKPERGNGQLGMASRRAVFSLCAPCQLSFSRGWMPSAFFAFDIVHLNAIPCNLQYKRAKIYMGEWEKKISFLLIGWPFLLLLYIDIKGAPMTIFLIFKTITKITSPTMLFICTAPSLRAWKYEK